MTLRSFALLTVAALLLAGLALARPGPAPGASAQKLERLEGRIDGKRGRIAQRRGRERVLTADVRRLSERIGGLGSRIADLRRRQGAAQVDLDRSRARLHATQTRLRTERARLTRLRARLARARRILSARLFALYRTEKPDLVGVVLNSGGFADLVERAAFLRRIGRQDQRIMHAVRDARREAVRTGRRLSTLERGRRGATERIAARRDEIAGVATRLRATRARHDRARDRRTKLLRGVRLDRHELEEDLDGMRAQQSRIRARLSRMPAGGAVRRGGGRLGYPADGTLTSSFGTRWGRLHAGIDISVPTGTAVHAAAGGRVAIAGWTGGYGNYVCVEHGGGLSTCYGHNSRLGVRVGGRVTRGQVIAASGSTGHSTGPHIHFETRVGGVPRDPMGYL